MPESNTVCVMSCDQGQKWQPHSSPRCWVPHRNSARRAMLGADCLETGRCLRNFLLLHQPGFQEEATVSNPLMSFGKETLRIGKGEETLPLPLLLMSHCLRLPQHQAGFGCSSNVLRLALEAARSTRSFSTALQRAELISLQPEGSKQLQKHKTHGGAAEYLKETAGTPRALTATLW